MSRFFTIGHSTHSFEVFLELLQASAITCVVDVRRLPGSRKFPQYNGPTLASLLTAHGIRYLHLAGLGGRRLKPIGKSHNAFWQNGSFRNYADYAWTAPFQFALETLTQRGEVQTCAIMCAEALWWRCHRRIIADYLLADGHEVFHIEGPTRVAAAVMTPIARPISDGRILYSDETLSPVRFF
jgi:uncharacterized protein (DUF488 family)